MAVMPSPPPPIDVTPEAHASLREHLARSGPAQLIRIHAGFG
jgi:hypothetical protein